MVACAQRDPQKPRNLVAAAFQLSRHDLKRERSPLCMQLLERAAANEQVDGMCARESQTIMLRRVKRVGDSPTR